MTMPNGPKDDGAPDEIDLLLPWHAVERLSPEEAERVEAALAHDPARARHLAVVREERAETVALNQDLGAPSRAARDALFARIAAEGVEASPSGGLAKRIAERVGAWIAGLAPSTLAWSGAAAAVVIALQAGFLAKAYRSPAPAGFETASGPDAVSRQSGSFALVAFAPTATAAQIDAALRDAGAVIVDGPRAGGLYRLRMTGETKAEAVTGIEKLRAATGVVRLLLPEGPATRP